MRESSPRRVRALIAAAVVAVLTFGGGVSAASAANAYDFDPGRIISDEVFYNSSGMTQAEVQAFLDAKVPVCRSGASCLKNYGMQTWTRPANPMCGAYTSTGWESAAQIIWRVGQACGINPQVLIVLLQKEQGLITSTAPTSYMYRSATGYGCPDTAACDAEYYGFFNQVYMGAYAFKRYANPPGTGPGTDWPTIYNRYAPGKWATVQWHPNIGCGTSQVYIQNQATASLYTYTPYRPNSAAIAAGWGTGDSCSSYGNRNFFMYFTEWFGSIDYSVRGAIGDYYKSVGGASSVWGKPAGGEIASAGGWRQKFTGGTLYCHPQYGVFGVRGWIGDRYTVIGAERSALGFPIENERSTAYGAAQRFQFGAIYATLRATVEVRGWIGERYDKIGGDASPIGRPLSPETGTTYGAKQVFESGEIHASMSGTYEIRGAILTEYRRLGGDRSFLAAPLGAEIVTGGIVEQTFQGGVLSLDMSSGKFQVVRGWIGDRYRAIGGSKSALGMPLGPETSTPYGAVQRFTGGSIYATLRGTWEVLGALDTRYRQLGESGSRIGLPAGAPRSASGTSAQAFTAGTLVTSAAGTYEVRGWIGDRYRALDAERSTLGAPLGDETSTPFGAVQRFSGGSIYATLQGTWEVPLALDTQYRKIGEAASPIGLPAGAPRTRAGVLAQDFRAGGIYSTSAGAFEVRGWIGDRYRLIGAETSRIGAPIEVERGAPYGAVQRFAKGTVYATLQGTWEVAGSIGDVYAGLGAEGSRLGLPRSGEVAVSGGVTQYFERGRIVATGSGTTAYFD